MSHMECRQTERPKYTSRDASTEIRPKKPSKRNELRLNEQLSQRNTKAFFEPYIVFDGKTSEWRNWLRLCIVWKIDKHIHKSLNSSAYAKRLNIWSLFFYKKKRTSPLLFHFVLFSFSIKIHNHVTIATQPNFIYCIFHWDIYSIQIITVECDAFKSAECWSFSM